MNGENLIFIYSPQDGEQEKLWCSKLAQELRGDGIEVIMECGEPINNRIYRCVNLWSNVVVLVCSADFLSQYFNNQLARPNELFCENFDMGRLIICLHGGFENLFPNLAENVVTLDFRNDIATNFEIKTKILNIINVKKR